MTNSAPGKGFLQLSLTGSRGTIVEYDIFHPAAGALRGECQLLDGVTYSMERVVDMFRKSLCTEEDERLFPYGITGGMPLELWDFIDAMSTGRDVEINAEEGLRSKAVSEALYESGTSGEVVKVNDVIKGKVNAYQRDIDDYWKL